MAQQISPQVLQELRSVTQETESQDFQKAFLAQLDQVESSRPEGYLKGYHHIVDIVRDRAETTPNEPCVFTKINGKYRGITFELLYSQIMDLAWGLKKMGIHAHDKVALLSENRQEWIVTDLAIMALGAVSVPIYHTLSASEIKEILNDSGVRMVVVSTFEQGLKIKKIFRQCPSVEHVTVMDCGGERHPKYCKPMNDIFKLGQMASQERRFELERNMAQFESDRLATIVYTSGTTGGVKGVMLTHGNILANIESISQVIPISEKDRTLSMLPLSHVFERICGCYYALYRGTKINFAESIHSVIQNVLEVRPTVVVTVPRFFEKIHAKIMSNFKPHQKWMIKVTIKTKNRLDVRSSIVDKLIWSIMSVLVLRKFKARFGGCLRFCISGGAPLPKSLARYFDGLGMLILEGYGLTEASPVVATGSPEAYKHGTVGKALPGLDVRLAGDGELLVRGPNIMQGYYQKPRETQETIDKDGWLHTGDLAQIDSEGFIKIVGRKKEILVLSSGKNVCPIPIEDQIRTSRYINQVMLIGDQRAFVSCLLVPNFHELIHYAERTNIVFETLEDLLNSRPIQNLFRKIIDRKTTDLASFSKIRDFRLMPREFVQERGEMTAKLSFRRSVIEANCKFYIDDIYKTSK